MLVSDRTIDEYTQKAAVMVERKNFDGMLFVLETLLDPKNSYHHSLYGVATLISKVAYEFATNQKLLAGKLSNFINCVDQFVEKQKRDLHAGHLFRIHEAEAMVLWECGDKEGAAKYYSKAIAEIDKEIDDDPLDVGSYCRKVNLMLICGKRDEAKEILDRITSIVTSEEDEKNYRKTASCYREGSYLIFSF